MAEETAAADASSQDRKPSGHKSSAVKPSVPIIVRAKSEVDQKLLVAATEGDIVHLESAETKLLQDAICTSGCTLLHWAAGSNQVGVLEYLLSPSNPIFDSVDLPVTKCKKSLGRTPLHYACRNGCLEAVRWLVLEGGASIDVQARQGVTPFQLAVWQNRLDICMFLKERAQATGQSFDPAKDFNDFGCGAVHWLGIAPETRANFRRGNKNDNSESWYSDGRDLLPLAKWLASLPGIDFAATQRQNHTGLHKAAWGGHLAIVEYLHTEHNMWDEVVDDAGNYAASLADMAHTPKHAQIANYLRRHCSRKKAQSLAILGLTDATATKEEIRKAYLLKARQLHPDRLVASKAGEEASVEETVAFDELRKAYKHLTEEDGVGDQSNPAHSLNLMLQYVNSSNGSTNTGKSDSQQDSNGEEEDDSFFKARLVAVLLEYGDKGIDLSNVKKKWKQVWPEVPFPSQQRKASQKQQAKKMTMGKFLMQKAGDVIRFERYGEKKRRVLVLLRNRNSSKESVLRSASLATGTTIPEKVEEIQ